MYILYILHEFVGIEWRNIKIYIKGELNVATIKINRMSLGLNLRRSLKDIVKVLLKLQNCSHWSLIGATNYWLMKVTVGNVLVCRHIIILILSVVFFTFKACHFNNFNCTDKH